MHKKTLVWGFLFLHCLISLLGQLLQRILQKQKCQRHECYDLYAGEIPLKLAIYKRTEFQLGTPLHTWGQFYRHLLMTQDTSGNIRFILNKLGNFYRFIHMSHLNEGEHLNLVTFEQGKRYINGCNCELVLRIWVRGCYFKKCSDKFCVKQFCT